MFTTYLLKEQLVVHSALQYDMFHFKACFDLMYRHYLLWTA